jgi:KUP system potassium uptake protein
MIAWRRGAAAVARAEARGVPMADVIAMLHDRPPMRAKGLAVFLTEDPDEAPAALLHNLKHNQVVHEQVLLLTVRVLRRPRVAEADRVDLTDLAPGFRRLILSFGFMESPDVARGLALARAKGLTYDLMRTSFFLSRRTLVNNGARGLGQLLNGLYIYLVRNAVRTADFFHIPPARVVELGAQVQL